MQIQHWNTRYIRSPSQTKDNVKHYSWIICEGNCSCGENYAAEFVRNVVLRWTEHEDPNKLSKLAKYFLDHHVEWKVLTRTLE